MGEFTQSQTHLIVIWFFISQFNYVCIFFSFVIIAMKIINLCKFLYDRRSRRDVKNIIKKNASRNFWRKKWIQN